MFNYSVYSILKVDLFLSVYFILVCIILLNEEVQRLVLGVELF